MKHPPLRGVRRTVVTIIDKLSFSDKIRDLVVALNQKVEHVEDAPPAIRSHPGGFRREFSKRRIGIAEAYVTVKDQLGAKDYQHRLDALRTLRELSLHAKTVDMPLNTARVQIALMKEALRNQGNKRRQMEDLTDFATASFGQESVIRRFLREFNIIQMPETGQPLEELDLGWDSHVHDNISEGRKTPSQVLIDAYIKGLSRLTLVYQDLSSREIITEALMAGGIMGIEVTVGIEFSVGPRCRRKHFVVLIPGRTPEACFRFVETNAELLRPFVEGLEENRRRKQAAIASILEHFNASDLKRINEGYEDDEVFGMAPLELREIESIAVGGQYSRIHLSELIFTRLRDVMRKRVLAQKLQVEVSQQLLHRGKLTRWELETTMNAYRETRERYENLTPHVVMDTCLEDKSVIDYDSVFASEKDILPALKKAGGTVVYIHPLAQGEGGALATIVEHHASIDRVELINMYDSVQRNPADILDLAAIVRLLNAGKREQLLSFLKDRRIPLPDPERLEAALDRYGGTPLVPLAGSDSTGREPHIPGMGFIVESRIPAPSRKRFVQSHFKLPAPVARLITGGGLELPDGRKDAPDHVIYSMGKSGSFVPNPVGDEEPHESIGPVRFWRYLNPSLKRLLRVAVASVPACLVLHPAYAALWLGITFTRNVLVDLIAASGLKVGEWHGRDVNFDYATQSVFWTGFSIPLLALIKQAFDLTWPLEHQGPLFEWCKFFLLCFANGTYISAHNTIRGFNRGVVRANFFRSVLAWPFASVFAPVGNFLMIPSIVQAKIWSDVVAGLIEGTGKFRQKIVVRRRDLAEILPALEGRDRGRRYLAMLDVLHIWARQHRGRTALARLLLGRKPLLQAAAGLFRKKKSSPPAENPRARIEVMVELFQPQRAATDLSRFIMENFRSREAVILSDLAGGSLAPFHAWLKKIEKKAT
jgi:predicted metal-dependent phosphoesterase TrpH